MKALAFWLPVLLLPYWLGPIVVWLTQRWSVRPDYEPFDPIRHRFDADLMTGFERSRDALMADGFASVADFVFPQRRVRTRVGLFVDRAKGDLALAVAMQSTASARIAACYVEFPARFRDGRSVSVKNSSQVGAFRSPSLRTVVQFPDVRDPVRLRRVQAAFLQRYFTTAERVPFEHEDDPARFLVEGMVRELSEQVEAGTWWRDDVAQVFRPTFRGAWLATWRLLPPFVTIRRMRVRRRAAALLTELGLDGVDAHPIPSPRRRPSFSWSAFILAAALLFYVGGPLLTSCPPFPSSDRVTIPADFVVPADFPGAVRALERLAGSAASPLTGIDTLGRVVPTPGFAVGVRAARAEGLVAGAQQRFLDRGFYLFRSEQHFGIRNAPDRVALFPRADPFEILRLMGTNGANYGIGSDSIVAWLRALGRDQPFVLTGIGFDWVEGRFTTDLRDPAALARRFYSFCPDIVDQGTETIAALVDELRRSRHLYCWWD